MMRMKRQTSDERAVNDPPCHTLSHFLKLYHSTREKVLKDARSVCFLNSKWHNKFIERALSHAIPENKRLNIE